MRHAISHSCRLRGANLVIAFLRCAIATAERCSIGNQVPWLQSIFGTSAGAPSPKRAVRQARAVSEQAHKERINAWTVGLAAGRIEGAPLQFAAELARVLDDGDNMRVLPIVTRGPFDNVYDLLYLRGVDAAIVYGDVLDHFKTKPEFANAWRRINYLLSLFPSEVHVFVRPEINIAPGPRRQGRELQYRRARRQTSPVRSSSSSSASR